MNTICNSIFFIICREREPEGSQRVLLYFRKNREVRLNYCKQCCLVAKINTTYIPILNLILLFYF